MRKSSFQDLPYIEYSPELFVNAITVGGIKIAPLGDGRYAATWPDDKNNRPRMTVGGMYSAIGVIYRNVTETNKESN